MKGIGMIRLAELYGFHEATALFQDGGHSRFDW